MGDGPRDLVVIPGFVSHQEILWELPAAQHFLRRLTSFARVILYDKREQGLSDRVGRPPTLEESMDDLRAVMDAAGSRARRSSASRRAGRWRSSSPPPTRTGRRGSRSSAPSRACRGGGLPAGLPAEMLERFAELVRERYAQDELLRPFAPTASADREVRDWGASSCAPARARAAPSSCWRCTSTSTSATSCPRSRRRRWSCTATGDLVAPIAHGRYIAEHVPGARFVELAGNDHLPFVGGQDDVLDEIEEHITGTRSAREPDRVLATVLFTDICASTERAAAMGDARWRNVLTEHDRLVRHEVERRRGRFIKSTGDGALATFDGPARAIEGAAAIRGGDPRPRARDPGRAAHRRVRADRRRRRRDRGPHRGARRGDARPRARSACRGRWPTSWRGPASRFEDRGEHELKGVPGAWRLLAVAGPENAA